VLPFSSLKKPLTQYLTPKIAFIYLPPLIYSMHCVIPSVARNLELQHIAISKDFSAKFLALPYLLDKPYGGGECRYCRSNISVHAVVPLVEMTEKSIAFEKMPSRYVLAYQVWLLKLLNDLAG